MCTIFWRGSSPKRNRHRTVDFHIIYSDTLLLEIWQQFITVAIGTNLAICGPSGVSCTVWHYIIISSIHMCMWPELEVSIFTRPLSKPGDVQLYISTYVALGPKIHKWHVSMLRWVVEHYSHVYMIMVLANELMYVYIKDTGRQHSYRNAIQGTTDM